MKKVSPTEEESDDGNDKPISYTVTFNSTGGTAVETQTVKNGEKASRPSDPTREAVASTNYAFAGWYTSTDGGTTLSETPFDFDTAITANTVLYAKWEEQTLPRYTITYDLDGGDWAEGYTAPATFTEEDAVSLPDASSVKRQGYGFTGWHEVSSDGTVTEGTTSQIALGTKENKSFKAYYERKTITYTFDANGGSWADGSTENRTISGLYEAEITNAPEKPTRTGYSFAGWDAEIGSTFAAEDKTFTAQWTANALGITVTLESVSGDENLSIEENDGTLTATSGFASYTWKIDGSMATDETGSTYTPTSLSVGYHNITLIVTDSNGGVWSATAVITVQN
ncbi:MAG: InlB B-repeat-containing protein [Treponema sp.]|nr:InlB B-repeat-containing protein [Treponema sp.]